MPISSRGRPQSQNLFNTEPILFSLMIAAISLSFSACIEDPPRPMNEQETERSETLREMDTVRDADISLDVEVADMSPINLNDGLSIPDDYDALPNDQGLILDFAVELDSRIPLDWELLNLTPPEIVDERCDGLDNDLDGLVDETLSNPCGGCVPLNEEVGCVGWRANFVETQQVNERGDPIAGTLNPQRLIALSASVLSYERFNLGEVECVRYGAPSSWAGARSIGEVSITAPRADLTLVPSSEQPGRYRALGLDETPFVLHSPADAIDFTWEGQLAFEEPEGRRSAIEEGELSLTSPPLVRLATDQELEELIDIIQSTTVDRVSGEYALRWIAEPSQGEAGPPLTLYVGGSQSLFRAGAYQGIRHYQLNARLFDDGLFELSLPDRLRVPQSSVWVYLERVKRQANLSGINPISISAGHRVEARRSGGGNLEASASIELISPDPQAQEPDPQMEGLEVAWRSQESQEDPNSEDPPESAQVSLILYDNFWSESLTCFLPGEMLTRPQSQLIIPAEKITFWPQGPQSVRQLTVSTTVKSLDIDYPDTGRWRLTDSLILRLSDL